MARPGLSCLHEHADLQVSSERRADRGAQAAIREGSPRIHAKDNEEAVKYLENKLNVNKIDSLTFFSDSILGKVNALIEEGVIVKEELKNADSIIVAQDSLIQDQDSLINVILERETEELNFYEKQTNALNKELKKEKKKRKFFQGTTIISGIIVLLLL